MRLAVTCRLRGIKTHHFIQNHLFLRKSLFATLFVIVFCLLQQAVPCHSRLSANPIIKSTDERTLNRKVRLENDNHIHDDNPATITSSTRQGGKNSQRHHHHYNDADDIDVVGYGEDCSFEGPFCDESRHLTCDYVDETCICDETEGYVHINDVRGVGGTKDHSLFHHDKDGNPSMDLNGNICVSKQEVIEKTEQLLGYSMGGNDVNRKALVFDEPISDVRSWENQDYHLHKDLEKLDDDDDDDDDESKEEMNVYDKIRQSEILFEEQPNSYNDQRLERFQLHAKAGNAAMSEKELIIKEILKYRVGAVGLDEFKTLLEQLLDIHFTWRTNKLSNSICSNVFDVDRDGLFTHEDYVTTLFSENIRSLVLPKAFNDLIGPLVEESCISMEDLRALDHNSETLRADFAEMDNNGDNCVSILDFVIYASVTCRFHWLSLFFKEAKLENFLNSLDPTPEEIYARRLLENERLIDNWKVVDQDKDGFLSLEELTHDLDLWELPSENLMNLLDKNNDGKISLREVKQQISVPELQDVFQYDWLESLYHLHETDEEEVAETLETLIEGYKDILKAAARANENANKSPETTYVKKTDVDRMFEILDRNSNGEMDQVEFKLLMELMKKYVLFGLLNETIDEMDMNSDGKVSVFEYQEYFFNDSATSRIFFRNLLALEEYVEELQSSEDNWIIRGEDDDDEIEEDYTEEGTDEPKISTTKLSKRAAASNESAMVYRIFLRLDTNLDGILTKEDFYKFTTASKTQKTVAELEEEFSQLDIDDDGLLTIKDSKEFLIPIDFKKFVETTMDAYSEEVSYGDLEIQYHIIDRNMDGVIQKKEFLKYKVVLFSPGDEKAFMDWVENYLSEIPTYYVDEASRKAFAEFDTNCDRFISEAEFKTKLDTLREKSKSLQQIMVLAMDDSLYFSSLDLNKDGKISHNEFQLLLLRTGKTLSSK